MRKNIAGDEVMTLDATFTTFQQLAKLAKVLLPHATQYTAEQVDALHEYANLIAKELLNGNYVYRPRGKR